MTSVSTYSFCILHRESKQMHFPECWAFSLRDTRIASKLKLHAHTSSLIMLSKHSLIYKYTTASKLGLFCMRTSPMIIQSTWGVSVPSSSYVNYHHSGLCLHSIVTISSPSGYLYLWSVFTPILPYPLFSIQHSGSAASCRFQWQKISPTRY